MSLTIIEAPAPAPLEQPRARSIFWIEHVDGWRVDVVESGPLSPAGWAYRGIVTTPAGRRLHKTLPFPTPAEAELFANAIVDCERVRTKKYRPGWTYRARAWLLRVFRVREVAP